MYDARTGVDSHDDTDDPSFRIGPRRGRRGIPFRVHRLAGRTPGGRRRSAQRPGAPLGLQMVLPQSQPRRSLPRGQDVRPHVGRAARSEGLRDPEETRHGVRDGQRRSRRDHDGPESAGEPRQDRRLLRGHRAEGGGRRISEHHLLLRKPRRDVGRAGARALRDRPQAHCVGSARSTRSSP